MQLDLTKPAELAIALLDTIIMMSDEAERLGGASSIAGVASLHRMQASIQKNKVRVREAIAAAQRKAS